MPVKLIASDMDGTLLMDDHVTISERNLRAIREAIRRGIHFVPASGRMLTFLPQALVDIPEIRYAITSNGAAVYDLQKKEHLFRTPIQKSDLPEILKIAPEDRYLFEMYSNGQSYIGRAGIHFLETHEFPEWLRMFVEKKRTVVDSLAEFVQRDGVEIEKINFPYLSAGERDILWKQLEQIPTLSMTSSGFENLEVNHKNANKGAALRALCDHLGISIADTIAFGDGHNDCQMLRDAGIGVAMANAKEEIQQAADHITLTNEQDGVAVFLEQHLQG